MAKEKTTLQSIVIIRRTGVKTERSWKNRITKTATERITITCRQQIRHECLVVVG